jgi:hydrogenase-4 component B
MSFLDGVPAPTTALFWLLLAGALLAASGVPGLCAGWRSAWGARIATTLVVTGSLVGIGGACLALRGAGGALAFASPLPGAGGVLAADALSGFFALPIFLVGGLGSLYGTAYWPQRRHPRNARRTRLCYGLLLASMLFITLARDGASFLVAWEAMALTNYLLVTVEDADADVRSAGWLYLLYSHFTVLCLFALFLVERQLTGELGFGPVPAGAPAHLRVALFVLALAAFATKAGAMPMHSWLPGAHASAPSHVSAVMSGVVLKMGIYGLVRVCGLFEAPPLGFATTLLALGAASAFFGVVFALGQHDFKRLLAFHSIENIGIILLGLGLAMLGRATGNAAWTILGLAGCLLHVWNHALFKSLLFFGAGSVVRATGSRNLEAGGGLARRMPATATLFLVGALAICGLPPFNGFVSELLVYLGLARTALVPASAWAALPVPVLAATGALAVACFVKVFGILFLGTPRSRAAAAAHESPALMLAPMALLALVCVVLGSVPMLAAPALDGAIASWNRSATPLPALASLAPLGRMPLVALTLVGATTLVVLLLLPAVGRARRRQPSLPAWDCGYATSSPRLQYTASSFAEIITSRFAWVLMPRVHRPRITGPFPAPATFASHVEDPLLDRLLAPATRAALRMGAALRALPRGQLQRYILYILAVLVALLGWALAAAPGGG